MENIENNKQLSEEEMIELVEGLSDRELEILYSFVVMDWDNLTEENRKVWSEILMALEYKKMQDDGNN